MQLKPQNDSSFRLTAAAWVTTRSLLFLVFLGALAGLADGAHFRMPDHDVNRTMSRFYFSLAEKRDARLRLAEGIGRGAADKGMAKTARKMIQATKAKGKPPGPGKVLFTVYTDSNFYQTRLTWVMRTWGKEIPHEALTAIGDKEDSVSFPGLRLDPTQCPQHSHWEGACCKYAEAVIKAHELMQKEASFEWAYFTDDDAYVRPGEITRALERQRKADGGQDKGVILGNFGCATKLCNGLCAGGGYAASRKAVERMVNNDEVAFVKEQMQMCNRCDRWADQALSTIQKERGLELRPLAGLYGWFLSAADFSKSLNGVLPDPLMYHYVRTKNQMDFLDGLFANTTPPTPSKSAHGYDNAGVPDSGKRATVKLATSNKPDYGPCLTYHGRSACALSNSPLDIPFYPASGAKNGMVSF